MANRIQIRTGTAVPTTSNLLYRELGYSTGSKQLYINDNGTIRSIGINSILISSATDLNNLTTEGFYYCPANATVATLVNCPTANAFSLLVEKHAGCKQTLTEYMTSGGKTWTRNYYNNAWGSWSKAWTETTDGSGSGLDADLVDGKHASAFSLAAHTHDANEVTVLGNRLTVGSDGKISVNNTAYRNAGMYGVYDSTKTGHIWSMGPAYSIDAAGAGFGTIYGMAYKHTNNTTGGTMAGGHQIVFCSNGTPGVAIGLEGNIWAKGSIYEGTTALNTRYLGISAKAADSNLLDGYNSASAGTANTIALRDSAGDIACRLLRPTYANQTDISGAIAFRTNNSTDNYVRFCSNAAAIRTFIGAAPTSHTHTAAQLPNAYSLLWSGTISATSATATLNSAYTNFDFLIVVIALDNAASENHVPVTIPVGTISTNARRFSSGIYMSGTTYMYLNFTFPSTTSIQISNLGGALTKAIKYVYGVNIV